MSDRLAQLHKLLAADPQDTELMYMIAMEEVKRGSTEAALAWLDRAIAARPGFLYAYFQQAKLLGELGRDDPARLAADAGIARAQQAGDAKALDELRQLRQSLD